MKRRRLEEQLFLLGIIVPAVVAVLIPVYRKFLRPLFPIRPCIWNAVFGIYCPGCGGTRAVEALLQGRILLSLWYHPVVLYGVGIYVAFMVSRLFAWITGYRFTKGMRFHDWYLYAALVIIALNFIVKNILRKCFGIMM